MQARFKNSVLVIVLTVMVFGLLPDEKWTGLPNTAVAQVRDSSFNKVFEQVFPKLNGALDRVDKHKDLPRSAWFSEDQGSNVKEIRKLLDEMIEILGISDINGYRQEISSLEQNIQESKEKIVEYNQKKITAPKDSFFGLHDIPFRVTKKGYQNRVEGQYELIDEYEKRIEDIGSQLAAELSKIGLALTGEQLDLLLSSVVGNDMISMSIVFNNVREITIELEKLTNESGENVDAARRYYGVYTVLLRVLDRMQKKFIDDVDRKYIPTIEKYLGEAKRNIAEAKAAISKGQGNREILENNIAANKLTQKASQVYRSHLDEQRKYVQELNEALADDIFTAENTYKTVSLSSNVIAMLRVGIQEFEALINLKIPEIRIFENQDMKVEFRKLTNRMKEST
ncbi:MAG: hypothetical protein ACE5IR_17925 [bacterium]